MLAAETTSTAAKPSTILPRNRRVGSPRKLATDLKADRDGDRRRLNNPTSKPRLLSDSQADPKTVGFPDPMPKPRAEWIRGRKFTVTAWRPRGAPGSVNARRLTAGRGAGSTGAHPQGRWRQETRKPSTSCQKQRHGAGPGLRRGERRNDRDITMTPATKILVAKSRPGASN
jgi:hypothetical protein